MAADQTDFETRIAHLERMVEDLSDVVVEQSRALDLAQRRLAALMEREAEREADAGALPIADRKPPHW
jgi:SlyX protein